jgi:hypothetical protein
MANAVSPREERVRFASRPNLIRRECKEARVVHRVTYGEVIQAMFPHLRFSV